MPNILNKSMTIPNFLSESKSKILSTLRFANMKNGIECMVLFWTPPVPRYGLWNRPPIGNLIYGCPTPKLSVHPNDPTCIYKKCQWNISYLRHNAPIISTWLVDGAGVPTVVLRVNLDLPTLSESPGPSSLVSRWVNFIPIITRQHSFIVSTAGPQYNFLCFNHEPEPNNPFFYNCNNPDNLPVYN